MQQLLLVHKIIFALDLLSEALNMPCLLLFLLSHFVRGSTLSRLGPGEEDDLGLATSVFEVFEHFKRISNSTPTLNPTILLLELPVSFLDQDIFVVLQFPSRGIALFVCLEV